MGRLKKINIVAKTIDGKEVNISKDLIINLKREQHKSNREIAEIFNIKTHQANNIINKLKVIYKEKDKMYLKELIDKGLNMEEIGARCGCHSRTISNNLKKLDLYKYFHTKRNNHHVLNKPKTNHKCCICNISQADGNDVRKFKGKYYCKKHYNHMYRHGKIIKQTIYDKNDIIKHSNYAEIVLKNINMDIVGKSIIDLEDIEKVKKYKWYLTNDNYCVTKGINKKNVYIHDLIMDNLDFKFKYDHQDKNKLNNRKSNLRKANFQQNAVNSHVRSTNNTGVTGVQYHKIKNGFNWVSSLTYMYKPIYLGTYDLFDEAVKARLKGELEYFKEFSPNYNPHTNTLQITYLSHDDNKQTYIEMNMKGSILKLKKI